jgi:hypothetical protein
MQDKLPKFTSALDRYCLYCLGLSLLTEQWAGGHRHTANLIQIHTRPSRILLYVKESNISPVFWGLNEPQLSSLDASGHPWYVVLLGASGENGWFLKGPRVIELAKERLWSVQRRPTGSDDYKIHRKELGDWIRFRFYIDFFRTVLPGQTSAPAP